MFFSAIKLSGITLRKDNNVGSAANTSTRVKLLDALTLNTHPKQKREENESYYFLDVIFNQLELNMYVRTKMLQMLKRTQNTTVSNRTLNTHTVEEKKRKMKMKMKKEVSFLSGVQKSLNRIYYLPINQVSLYLSRIKRKAVQLLLLFFRRKSSAVNYCYLN